MIKIILLILLFLCCVAFGGLAGYHISKKKFTYVFYDIFMFVTNASIFTVLLFGII